MFKIILYHPQIPPNTGNIIRLAANLGGTLHLIEPLGFSIDDRRMRRAGLDYHELTSVRLHACFEDCIGELNAARVFTVSTKGARTYSDSKFLSGDAFVFGSETTGLPVDIRESVPPERQLRIPMQPANRSLNLSNSVAIVLYEAWRQLGFRE